MLQGSIVLLIAVLWPMLGALVGYVIGRKNKAARDYLADFVGVSEFALLAVLLVQVCRGNSFALAVPDVCGQGLYLELDGFRALFGAIAALLWMMTSLFSREYLKQDRNRNRYYLFTLLTCGATMGVFLSADLFTTFLFFEIMSFTSYVMVIQDETKQAMRAGQTYIAVAVLGGMVTLVGLFLLQSQAGTLRMDELLTACAAVKGSGRLYLSGALILFGFAAKASMFPLHVWLPDSYAAAPAPATALLSGILTKAGVFGMLAVSANIFLHDAAWGSVILAFGIATMLLGALIALFSMNLKRTLAGSSMSQIGFILVGLGMQGLLGEENALAVWGTNLHMVNHSLLKLVLFLAAGVVFMNLRKLDLNEVRGFGRGKPLLMVLFLMAYLGIIGMPLWNGYASKTLLHESIVEYIEQLSAAGAAAGTFRAVEWIFLFSGGLTAAYMTKLFVALFVEKNPYHQDRMEASNRNYMNWQSALALGVPALLLPVLGFFPGVFLSGMGELSQGFVHGRSPEHTIAYFSWENLKGAAISLAIGAAVYLIVVRGLLMRKDAQGNRVYLHIWPERLGLERLVYRPLCKAVVFVMLLAARIVALLPDALMALLRVTVIRKKKVPPKNTEEHERGELMMDFELPSSVREVTDSLSFSLLLFGIGFCAIMLYLLTILTH